MTVTQETPHETQAPDLEPAPGPDLRDAGGTAIGTEPEAEPGTGLATDIDADAATDTEPEDLDAKADVKQQARTMLAQAKIQTQQTYAKVATKAREHTPQPVQEAAAQAVHATEGKRTKLAAVSVALAAVLTALKLRKRHG